MHTNGQALLTLLILFGCGEIIAQPAEKDVSKAVSKKTITDSPHGGTMQTDATFFEPAAVHDYFLGITRLPHPSPNQRGVTGNEDPVRRYIVEQAQKIPGVEVTFYRPRADKAGDRVVILRRPGSGKYASKPPVILQAHLDMVVNPVTMEFPLEIIPDESQGEGAWIKARDRKGVPSTLGADDGIGVATALAVLRDERLRELPIECLFTVQEETDMAGAQYCPLDDLAGTALLNLDAEDLDEIIYGSAGGGETIFRKKITRFAPPPGFSSFRLSLSGLRGGHSGIDINKGRLNALKALGGIIARFDGRITRGDGSGRPSSYDLYLCDFRRADVHKANAIPASAEATVVLPRGAAENFTKDFISSCESLKAMHASAEDRMAWSIDTAPAPRAALDARSSDGVLCMISQIPSGPISMIPEVPDVVETSSNLFNVALDAAAVTVESSNRSSKAAALKALNDLQSAIGTLFDCAVTTGMNGYLSWQPDKNSRLLKIASEVYRTAHPEGFKATVIHAGLECGTLAARFLSEKKIKLDCISIGPTVRNPHTGNETLEIKSRDGAQTVRRFYDSVCGIIGALFDQGVSAKQ